MGGESESETNVLHTLFWGLLSMQTHEKLSMNPDLRVTHWLDPRLGGGGGGRFNSN